MRFLVFLGIVAALAAAAILAGRLFPSEKDRVRSRLDAFVRALEEEDLPGVEAFLAPSFEFEGAVGSGNRDEALARVRRLAAEPESLSIRMEEVEAEFEGERLRMRIEGSGSYGVREGGRRNRRFTGAGGWFEARLEMRKGEGGEWRLESAAVESQDPFARIRGGRRER